MNQTTAVPETSYAAGALPPELLPPILDELPVAVCVRDLGGGFLFVNRPFAQMFGVDAGAVAGKKADDVLPAALAGVLRAGDGLPLATGQPGEREASGYRLRTFPLRGGDGQIQALCSVWTDISEQKRAEEQMIYHLRDSDERLRLALEAAQMGTWELDLATGEMICSQETDRLFGIRPGQTLHRLKTLFHRVHPDDAPNLRRALSEAALAPQRHDFHVGYRIRLPGGGVRWVMSRGAVLRDARGNGMRLAGVLVDVTPQRQAQNARRIAEQALSETQARLQAIVDNMPAIVFVKDRDGRYLLVNRAFERVWGCTRSEILGRTDLDLVPADLAHAIRAHDRKVLELPEPETREMNMHAHDGTPMTLFSVHFPLRHPSGEPYAVCGLAMDITERKQDEDALRKYRDVFEFIEQGLVVSATDAPTLEMVNPAYARMHGYTVEEMAGLPIAEVFAAECREEVPEMIRIADKRGHHTYESMHLRKDGSTFPVHIAMTAVKDAGGELLYRIGNVQDITERKQAEKTLRERAELLDLTQDAILVHEMDGRIVYWNAAAQAMYGWTAEEAHGQDSDTLLKTVFPDTASAEYVDAYLLAHGFWEGELVHTRRDNTQVFVSSRQALRRDPRDGRPIAILEVNSDITARKQAEAAQRAIEEERYWLMREAQNRAAELAGVMESIPDALLIGNEAVFTLANQPALDLFGCGSVEELNRQRAAVAERAQTRDARTGEHLPPEQWPFHRALAGAPEVQDLVIHHARLGRDVILRSAAAPVRVHNNIVGAVCVNTDLMRSRQQNLIHSLIEAQEEERRAVAYELHDGLTQYVMAAHAHLETFLHLSDGGAWNERADPEIRQSLEYLEQAVIESRRLINGLRALALEDLGLAGALEQTLNEEKARAEWSDAEMVHNIAGRRYPKIVETAVFRVAQEALTNARKHARTRRIRLLLLAGADEATGASTLTLEVRDWGSGFSPDAHNAEYGHLGLQGMVERVHIVGGAYHLHSAPGLGTTIHAVFPTCLAARDDGDNLPLEK